MFFTKSVLKNSGIKSVTIFSGDYIQIIYLNILILILYRQGSTLDQSTLTSKAYPLVIENLTILVNKQSIFINTPKDINIHLIKLK